GVSHLAFGQADPQLGGGERGVGVAGAEVVEARRARQRNRVVALLGPNAQAVQDEEYNRPGNDFGHCRGLMADRPGNFAIGPNASIFGNSGGYRADESTPPRAFALPPMTLARE